MQYGARQLGCTKVQVHSYPDEPSHGARCSSAPVVTRVAREDNEWRGRTRVKSVKMNGKRGETVSEFRLRFWRLAVFLVASAAPAAIRGPTDA